MDTAAEDLAALSVGKRPSYAEIGRAAAAEQIAIWRRFGGASRIENNKLGFSKAVNV
jgi:hypothetical protein